MKKAASVLFAVAGCNSFSDHPLGSTMKEDFVASGRFFLDPPSKLLLPPRSLQEKQREHFAPCPKDWLVVVDNETILYRNFGSVNCTETRPEELDEVVVREIERSGGVLQPQNFYGFHLPEMA